MIQRGVTLKTYIRGLLPVLLVAVASAACGSDAGPLGTDLGNTGGNDTGGDETGVFDTDGNLICTLDQNLVFASLPAEAIPALTRPQMVSPNALEAADLRDGNRVLGVVVNGEARAYPHNILWHHEIVNDFIGDTWISVSFCPLTGSGLVFDPFVDGERLELGVSGLLFANNLMVYDRISGDFYGPQLSVEGQCSNFREESLGLRSVQEMSWGRWKDLHPDTKVVGDRTGIPRNYSSNGYPYGNYDQLTSSDLLFPQDNLDTSRPIKERVMAIRLGEDGGRGYPFGELREMGETSVVNELVGGIPTAVFYESRDGETAVAFDARVEGETLTFSVAEDGTWVDAQTSSTWTIDGSAIAGEMAGVSLSTREDAYVVFWFAWRHFQPDGDTFLQ